MTTLQQDLRALVAANGFEMVHSALHEMMRQEYEFLSKIFKTGTPVTAPTPVPVASASAPVPVPAPAPAPEPVSAQPTEKVAKKVMKITVRKAVEEPLASPAPPPIPPTPALAPQPDESAFYAENSPINTLEMPADKGKFRSPAEVKRFQKDAEAKKRTELDAKGITVASLMTRDNLKRWIEDEGKSYAWVAREMVGCADTLVSNMAKNYGIQSKISKHKGMLMGLKA
jgi:outer membrane biosynthesis protein TonB